SIFDILEINDVNRALEDKRVFPLKTQYRMNPKIADIPNEFFYGKLLEHDQGTKQKLIYDAFSNEEPLVLVDTSSFNPWCSRLSIGGRYNIYHALVSTAISRELINENKVESVGIATPYRHQARLIQKIAEDWDIGRQVRINTVHSFQGGESDVIILDCVEGPGVNHWSMLDDQRSTDNDARKLLNVALTRAKCKIYIVAHQEHLFSKLSKESIILKILDKFQRNGCVKSSAELVDSYLATDFEKWTGLALASVERINWDQTTLFNEKDFWPAFLKDILSVEDRLIIFSPFVTTARVGYFMDYFRSLVNRGVELRIYTRPPYQHGARLKEQSKIVIDQVKKIGVKVKEQKSMHQKIAIIDDKIAWEGSLNILSHRDTHEQMRRIDGQNAVKEIIRNLEIGKEERFCPECLKHGIEAEMDIRNGRYGPFWGCSRYPECLYTENVARGRRL
ncbi:MAG: hypothetical protein GX930_08745, partial [Clostridia bacterium]|nr:hypothetical protein [Clostridia bacterium]